MKQRYLRFSLFLLAISAMVLTSCTIEKRHYRNGYYVDWYNNSGDRSSDKGRVEVKFFTEEEAAPVITDLSEATDSRFCSDTRHAPAIATDTVPDEFRDTISHDKLNAECKTPKPPDEDPTLPVHPDALRAKHFSWAGWGTYVLALIIISFGGTAIPAFVGIVFFSLASALLIVSLIYAYKARKDFREGTKYRGHKLSRTVIITGLLFFILHALAFFAIWLSFATGNINLTFSN